jgi:hypothetical protein
LSPAYTFNSNMDPEKVRAVWLQRYGVSEIVPAKQE